MDRLVRQICADIARFRRSVSPEADNVAERLAKLNRRFDKIGGSSLRHDEGEKAELVLKMLNEMMVFVSHSADDVEERRVGGFDDES